MLLKFKEQLCFGFFLGGGAHPMVLRSFSCLYTQVLHWQCLGNHMDPRNQIRSAACNVNTLDIVHHSGPEARSIIKESILLAKQTEVKIRIKLRSFFYNKSFFIAKLLPQNSTMEPVSTMESIFIL